MGEMGGFPGCAKQACRDVALCTVRGDPGLRGWLVTAVGGSGLHPGWEGH